jgi:hypothetical protein
VVLAHQLAPPGGLFTPDGAHRQRWLAALAEGRLAWHMYRLAYLGEKSHGRITFVYYHALE